MKYLVDEVAGMDKRHVKLRSGRTLSADILVIARAPLADTHACKDFAVAIMTCMPCQSALSSACASGQLPGQKLSCFTCAAVGCEVQRRPTFLKELGLGECPLY